MVFLFKARFPCRYGSELTDECAAAHRMKSDGQVTCKVKYGVRESLANAKKMDQRLYRIILSNDVPSLRELET